MERVTWKLTIQYVKKIANGNLLYVSRNSNGSVFLEGWDGEEMGARFKREGIYIYTHPWLIHVEV